MSLSGFALRERPSTVVRRVVRRVFDGRMKSRGMMRKKHSKAVKCFILAADEASGLNLWYIT